MSSDGTRTTTSIVAGIGTFVLAIYWLVVLVPAHPIDRMIDQYGLWIFLAILVAATAASGVATIRLSRWWGLVTLAGLAAVLKFTIVIIRAYRT
jgi:hypothetical protein